MTNAEINAFIAICDEMNISKAAEKLFISQSSLSTRIKTLERELGYSLFVRGKGQRKIVLTSEGEQFYELAIKYADIVNSMLEIGGKKICFRVSSVDSMGAFILTPVYEKFILHNPNIVLEISDLDDETVYENILKGNTDVAFYTNIKKLPEIEHVPIFSEKMVLVCSKDNDFDDEVELTDLDIRNEIYIPWFRPFKRWHNVQFGDRASSPHIKVELVSQLEYFLGKEKKWAMVPGTVAENLVKSKNFVKKKLSFHVPERTVFCSYMINTPNKNIIEEILKYIKEVILEMGDDSIKLLI